MIRLVNILIAMALCLALAPMALAQQPEKQESAWKKQDQSQKKQIISPEMLTKLKVLTREGKEIGKIQIMSPEMLTELKVLTREGEEIGKIKEFVIDSREGKVAYTVIGSEKSSGMFGDDQQITVPWTALFFQQQPRKAQDQNQKKEGKRENQESQKRQMVLVLDATRGQVLESPKGKLEKIFDRKQGRQIHEYYGLAPYWESEEKNMKQGDGGSRQQKIQEGMQPRRY